MAGHVKTPRKSVRSKGNLTTGTAAPDLLRPSGHHNPDVRPFVPRQPPVIAQDGIDDEPRALQAAAHLADRKRSEGEIERVLGARPASTGDVPLFERGQTAARVLSYGFDQCQAHASG